MQLLQMQHGEGCSDEWARLESHGIAWWIRREAIQGTRPSILSAEHLAVVPA